MNIGIIGYGKMGSAIFRLLSGKAYNVRVLTVSEAEAKRNEARLLKNLQRSLRNGSLSETDFVAKKQTLGFTHQMETLRAADLVIEAVFEDFDQKASVLRQLESVVRENAVLTTNTSSLSIEALANQLKRKARFCGLHFFHPVRLINLVEIIKWPGIGAEAIEFLVGFCKDIGRQPIVVTDSPGSMINSILAYYYVEGLYILEEGYGLPSRIDELAKRHFYLGPCESLDVIGIDFFLEALRKAGAPGGLSPITWDGAFESSISKKAPAGRSGYRIPRLLEKLVSDQRLGKKVSKGIYLYSKEKAVDDRIEYYLDPKYSPPDLDEEGRDALIAMRLLYSVFKGSMFSLRMGLSSRESIDQGVKEILLMERGPFSLMANIGQEKVREEFELLAQKFGGRFRPDWFR